MSVRLASVALQRWMSSITLMITAWTAIRYVILYCLVHCCINVYCVMVMMLTRNYAVNVVHAAFVGGIIGWILGPKK